jgi:hypothetical protein
VTPCPARNTSLWRDNLDEKAATIWMAMWCRSAGIIAGYVVARKQYFGVDCITQLDGRHQQT